MDPIATPLSIATGCQKLPRFPFIGLHSIGLLKYGRFNLKSKIPYKSMILVN